MANLWNDLRTAFDVDRFGSGRRDQSDLENSIRANRTGGGPLWRSGFFQPKQGTPAFRQQSEYFIPEKRAISSRPPTSAGRTTQPVHSGMPFRRGYGRSYGRRRTFRRRKTVSRRARRTAVARRRVPTVLATSGMARATVQTIGRMPIFKGAVFPTTLNTKLTWGRVITFTSAAVAYPTKQRAFQFLLNSAFDPQITPAGTQQPLYFDQLKGLYEASRVKAALITIAFVYTDATLPWEFQSHTTLGEHEATIPSDQQALAAPQATWSMMNVADSAVNKVSIQRYVNMNRFFGTDTRQSRNYVEEDAAIADQNFQCRMNVWVRHLQGSNVPVDLKITARVNIQQWVEFIERKNVDDA